MRDEWRGAAAQDSHACLHSLTLPTSCCREAGLRFSNSSIDGEHYYFNTLFVGQTSISVAARKYVSKHSVSMLSLDSGKQSASIDACRARACVPGCLACDNAMR